MIAIRWILMEPDIAFICSMILASRYHYTATDPVDMLRMVASIPHVHANVLPLILTLTLGTLAWHLFGVMGEGSITVLRSR